MMTLAENIQTRREAAELSRRGLDDAAGVPVSTTQKIEAGKVTNPSLEHVTALAAALDTTVGALLGEDVSAAGGPDRLGVVADPSLVTLPLSALRIGAGWNPRKTFNDDSIRELADSIDSNGLQQNLVVRPAAEPEMKSTYDVVAGERRFRALQLLSSEGKWGPDKGVAVRITYGEDADMRVVALLENLQREDVPAMEEAEAFAQMQAIDKKKWSTANIAKKIGKTQRYVQLRLALLKLDGKVQDAVREGGVTIEQARAMTAATPEKQALLVKRIANGNTGVQRAEDIRRMAVDELVPFDKAIFPVEKYKGEVKEDVETGARYMVDVEAFMKLQKRAAETRVAELGREWAWAELVEGYYWSGRAGESDDKAKAGAIVQLSSYDGTVQIHTGVLRDEDEEADPEEDARLEAERLAAEKARKRRDVAVEKLMKGLGDAIAGAETDTLARVLVFSIIASGTSVLGPDEWAWAGGRATRWLTRFEGLLSDDEDVLAMDYDWPYADTAPVWQVIAGLPGKDVLQMLADLAADTLQFVNHRPSIDTGAAAIAGLLGVEIPAEIPIDEPEPEEAESDDDAIAAMVEDLDATGGEVATVT